MTLWLNWRVKHLKLFQPKRAFGLPCPSAFCVKLETYLRMAEIPYEIHAGDPREAPKGKVPWIDDNGHVLGDSSFIIDYLKDKTGDPLDGKLTLRQRAEGHAIQKMLEDNLYFVASYSKWSEDDAFAIYSAELFAGMPAEQLEYVPAMVRKKALEKFDAQGIGRHSDEEIYALGCRDVQAFSELLAAGPYLFGNELTSFDASAFGVIGNIKDGPFASPVQDAVRNTHNVAAYIDRIREQYFGDL
jgi:glutathione S-transferase